MVLWMGVPFPEVTNNSAAGVPAGLGQRSMLEGQAFKEIRASYVPHRWLGGFCDKKASFVHRPQQDSAGFRTFLVLPMFAE